MNRNLLWEYTNKILHEKRGTTSKRTQRNRNDYVLGRGGRVAREGGGWYRIDCDAAILISNITPRHVAVSPNTDNSIN